MPSDNVDDSKVDEDVNILSKITRIVDDALADVQRLLMRSTCLLIVPVMTWSLIYS